MKFNTVTNKGTQMKINGCKNNDKPKRKFLFNSSKIMPRINTSSGKASYKNAVTVLIKMAISTAGSTFKLTLSIRPNKSAVKIPDESNANGTLTPTINLGQTRTRC